MRPASTPDETRDWLASVPKPIPADSAIPKVAPDKAPDRNRRSRSAK